MRCISTIRLELITAQMCFHIRRCLVDRRFTLSTITVVVPVYNVEQYLEKCVASLLSQSRRIDEIILVDDGSNDESGIIADKLAQTESSIVVIHQKNGGLSAARNTGINAAKSEYIGFVDSDDYVDKDMFALLIKQIEDSNADISICGVVYEQENGEQYIPYPMGMRFEWNKEEALIQLNSYKYFNMSFCDAIFRRSLFEGLQYGDEQLRFPVGKTCEDYHLMHKVVARCNKVVYSSEPLYHYVQRFNSISRNDKVSMAQVEASIAQLSFFKQWFPHLIYVAETACAFSHMGIYSAYLRKQIKCPPQLLKELRIKVRSYVHSVIKNKHIPVIKKAQAISFCYALPIYKNVIGRTKHR